MAPFEEATRSGEMTVSRAEEISIRIIAPLDAAADRQNYAAADRSDVSV